MATGSGLDDTRRVRIAPQPGMIVRVLKELDEESVVVVLPDERRGVRDLSVLPALRRHVRREQPRALSPQVAQGA